MKLGKVIAGIGLLIFTYLLLSKGKESTSIINTLAGNSIAGIKVLQGR